MSGSLVFIGSKLQVLESGQHFVFLADKRGTHLLRKKVLKHLLLVENIFCVQKKPFVTIKVTETPFVTSLIGPRYSHCDVSLLQLMVTHLSIVYDLFCFLRAFAVPC